MNEVSLTTRGDVMRRMAVLQAKIDLLAFAQLSAEQYAQRGKELKQQLADLRNELLELASRSSPEIVARDSQLVV